MASNMRAKQLDKIVTISDARKLRKQAVLAQARSELQIAEAGRFSAENASTLALQTLQEARLMFAKLAASDQARLWRSHCETKHETALIALDEALSFVRSAEAVVQDAIEDLLRHNFRHDRIVEHATAVHRQLRDAKEARSDEEFTDSRGSTPMPSAWDNG